jgi:hypothetical protein
MSNNLQNKKEELKRLVIQALLEEFKKPTAEEHEDLIAFSQGVEEGQELELTILTGGLCNFSYKLHFKDKGGKDDDALFVKLTFGTPVLFPGIPCSQERTKYEFKAMEMFDKITPYPESAVIPYLYFDMEGSEENMKVIVTQFSSRLHEQAANIFADGGTIDKAYATKIASSLAALHSAEVTEPDFNEGMKEFFLTFGGIMQATFAGYLDENNENPDRTAQRAREIGKDGMDEICEVYSKDIFRTDCYVHGDCHMFNMLVGDLASRIDEDEASAGDVAFVDWEFAHCGPMGKDVGFVQTFPLACALAHTINGDQSSMKSILEFLNDVWEKYSASINLDGKDLSLEDVYRNAVAYLGNLIGAYSSMGINMQYLPIEEGNTEALTKVRESLGVLSLEFYEIGFLGRPEGATLEDLRKRFSDVIQKELDHLVPEGTRRPSKRRSSLLRTSGRRVSDAHSYFGMAADLESIIDSNQFSEEFEELKTEFKVRFKSEIDVIPSTTRTSTKRSSNFSRTSRMSIALIDLKRKSLSQWDKVITDFSF